MLTDLYKENHIRTASGRMVNLLKPHPDSIIIEDIAHGLAATARFGGQTPYPFTVAQHSIDCANRVARQHKLAALLHDASEAYLGDIPTPLKTILYGYKKIEDTFMDVIAKKFGFKYPLHESVKTADKQCLESEWLRWNDKMLDSYTFTSSRTFFMRSFNELKNG